jgi:uncharacterized protein YggE
MSAGDRTPGTIRVEGRASRWVPADFADVAFTVVRRAKTSGEAVAKAGEAYAALDAALGGHADAIARRTTTSLSVHEVVHYDPKTGRPIRDGFEAQRTQSARFSPVGDAGAALRSVLVAVPELRVDGPVFGLEPSNPVHAIVRSGAAAAARSSAQAYAAGLGLGLGEVLRLREPRPSGPVGFAAGGDMVVARAKAVPDDGGESVLVDLTNEDVEVVAVVELVVAIA